MYKLTLRTFVSAGTSNSNGFHTQISSLATQEAFGTTSTNKLKEMAQHSISRRRLLLLSCDGSDAVTSFNLFGFEPSVQCKHPQRRTKYISTYFVYGDIYCTLYADRSVTTWVGTATRRLYSYQPTKSQSYEKSLTRQLFLHRSPQGLHGKRRFGTYRSDQTVARNSLCQKASGCR